MELSDVDLIKFFYWIGKIEDLRIQDKDWRKTIDLLPFIQDQEWFAKICLDRYQLTSLLGKLKTYHINYLKDNHIESIDSLVKLKHEDMLQKPMKQQNIYGIF